METTETPTIQSVITNLEKLRFNLVQASKDSNGKIGKSDKAVAFYSAAVQLTHQIDALVLIRRTEK